MKKMIFTLAALLIASVSFVSCSSDDEIEKEIPAAKTYKLTINASKGGDTRGTLTESGSIIYAEWEKGDEVSVYNSSSVLIGTLKANGAGNATELSGELTTAPSIGDVLTLEYKSPSYAAQDGTLAGIAANCDYATTTTTVLYISGNEISAEDAMFTNQQAIVKFTLKKKANDANLVVPAATTLTVNDGTNDIVVTPTSSTNVLYVAIPAVASGAISLTTTISDVKYIYQKSGVTINNGICYPITVKMRPEGTINSLFTINSTGDKVFFSKGNLQYIGSAATPYWKFADNQYDALGATTGQNSSKTNVDRDLFGWGTSGYDGKYPYYTTTDNSYYASGSIAGTNYDWGVYNAISNGSNHAGLWRTMTTSEWQWVIGPSSTTPIPGYNCRNSSTVNGVANARFAKAYLFGTTHGLILFPDSYSHPTGISTELIGINDKSGISWSSNQFTAEEWAKMEAAGAVFLPAAGTRIAGIFSSDPNTALGYWTSTPSNDAQNAQAQFNQITYSWFDIPSNTNKHIGCSVRLVTDAN